MAHKVTRHEVAGSMEVTLEADETLLLCSYGPIHVTAVGQHASLRQFDTVIFGRSVSTIRIETAGHAGFFLIEFNKLS